ncbi:cupredoxin domain-containing protein [Kitasatospora sp. NPDC058243]|uniref:cupredoxin domain-containing protein n=1 Tax=Kitasatospora sp. NPDC058243 TaxID=3346397 RepID=UPI0036DE4A27
MRPRARAVAAVLLGAALAACSVSVGGPDSGQDAGPDSGSASGPGPTGSVSATPATPAAPAASPSSATAPAPGAVAIRDFVFEPANFTVRPGAVVTVRNADTVDHTLTAQDRSFDTGTIAPGASATFTAPARPGASSYLCTLHHFMRGILTVS